MAFQTLTATTDRVPILTDTGINDFGIRLLTKRAMHAHNNSVKYPEHAKTRVSRVREILFEPWYHCQPPFTSIVSASIGSMPIVPMSADPHPSRHQVRNHGNGVSPFTFVAVTSSASSPRTDTLCLPISIMLSDLHHAIRSSSWFPIFTMVPDLHHAFRSPSGFLIFIPTPGTYQMPHLPSPLPITQHTSCTGRILINRPVLPTSPLLPVSNGSVRHWTVLSLGIVLLFRIFLSFGTVLLFRTVLSLGMLLSFGTSSQPFISKPSPCDQNTIP